MKDARRRFYLAIFALLGSSSGRARGHDSAGPGPVSHEFCAIDPKAIVSDACASFSTLDRLNNNLQPSIKSLTQDLDFFSYYRLNLYDKECPFWNDQNSMCGNIACAVNTIENEEDIPAIWRAEELAKLEGPKARHPSRQLQQETKPLMGELGDAVGESCVVEYDDECDERDYCVPEDESATSKGDYVSLVDNPERFTGYSGPGAHQVWEAIYSENCFVPAITPSMSKAPRSSGNRLKQAAQDLYNVLLNSGESSTLEDNECLEKRVFYRIISGMHASISTHLCHDYLNQTTGEWGPNVQCYLDRLHEYPERVSNLYFNYAVILRAIVKARPALDSYTFCSGDPTQDRLTKEKVLKLADKISTGPQIYDERLMFSETNGEAIALKEEFKIRFRNVSRTMDCVGCDKCRLWGKLQTAGYGAALKILFEFDESNPANNPPLRRTELVALVNTLDKVSSALTALDEFEEMVGHPVPASEDSTPPDFTEGLEEDLEDGLHNAEEPPSPKRKSQLRIEFEQEFGHVWETTIFVFQRWFALPGEILQFIGVELNLYWDIWLGRSATTGTKVKQLVGWEVATPPKHPKLKEEL